MTISRRIAIGLISAATLTGRARAADKIVGGTLGGQAPLWPFYVGAKKGIFAAEDLDVEINFAQSGPAVAQQLTGGAFDVALSIGNDNAMHAIAQGAPLAIVRIIGNTAPYALIAKPSLKTIADLKGKTISVGQINDVTTVYFERMAAANGLQRSDYDELVAGVAAARYAALKAGVADAAFVLPPLNFQSNVAGYVTLGYSGRLRQRPAVHRHGGAKSLGGIAWAAGQAAAQRDRQGDRLARRREPSRRSGRHSGQRSARAEG